MISRPLRALTRSTLPLLVAILPASGLAAQDSVARETERPVAVVSLVSPGWFEPDGWAEDMNPFLVDAAVYDPQLVFFSGRSFCADRLCKHPPVPLEPAFEGVARPLDERQAERAGGPARRAKE